MRFFARPGFIGRRCQPGFPEPGVQTGRTFPAPTGGFIEFLDAGAKPARQFGEIYNRLKKLPRVPGALDLGEGFGKRVSARKYIAREFGAWAWRGLFSPAPISFGLFHQPNWFLPRRERRPCSYPLAARAGTSPKAPRPAISADSVPLPISGPADEFLSRGGVHGHHFADGHRAAKPRPEDIRRTDRDPGQLRRAALTSEPVFGEAVTK